MRIKPLFIIACITACTLFAVRYEAISMTANGKRLIEQGDPITVLQTYTTARTVTDLQIASWNAKSAVFANATSLAKITESGGLPLWNGASWPGGYTLPVASAFILGGVKQGANTNIDSGGVISVTGLEPAIASGTTAQYWRGDKSWQTLNAGAVSGLAQSATTDTTNASNITSGTLPHAQLPALLSGDIPNNSANTSGSAATLTTPRAINGVYFDGSANITVADSTKVPTSTTVNGHALAGNVTVTASDIGAVTTVSGTAPVTSSGGATPAISMAQASGTVDGYLNHNDWTTFNSKQAAGSYVLTTTTVNGHALSGNVTVSASDLTTGTLPHAQLPALVSGDIPNNAASTSGSAATLTTPRAINGINFDGSANITVADSTKVPTTTTVNGHALSANVTVSASDLTTGTLPHAQLPALVSGDIPNNSANTSGSAGSATNITSTDDTSTNATYYPLFQTATGGTNPVKTSSTKLSYNPSTGALGATSFNSITALSSSSPAMDGTATIGVSTQAARADHVHPSDTSKVSTSTTVNGHALTGNVTVLASDIGAVTTVSGTAPVTSSGGATPAISMAQASGTVDGYLNHNDWTTFNSKQAAGSYVPTTTTVNGHALSGNVTVSASDLTTGTLPHAQLPALVSEDIPNNSANTSGSSGSATNITSTDDTSTNVTYYPLFQTSIGGTNPVKTSSTKLFYNPSTGALGATSFNSITALSSSNPAMDGTVTIGVSTQAARADHVHPSDTSKVSTSTTVNGHALTGNVTVTASDIGAVTTVTGSAPVTSSGGATPAISMAQASGSVDGYLNHNDWNTFNSLGGLGNVVSVTTAYTFASTDGVGLCNTSSGAFTISLPVYATVGSTKRYTIKNTASTGSPLVTVNAADGKTIDTFASITVMSGEKVTVIKDGSNWQTI
jgi:hypothetical protein